MLAMSCGVEYQPAASTGDGITCICSNINQHVSCVLNAAETSLAASFTHDA
jgi:hypothetical protein